MGVREKRSRERPSGVVCEPEASLEELAEWIRTGEEVEVVDNATGADVNAQTLTQIILDEGRRGSSFLPSALLHELVRAGEKAVHSGVERVQTKVDELLQASFDRLGPVRHARTEMARLRNRLEELESSILFRLGFIQF